MPGCSACVSRSSPPTAVVQVKDTGTLTHRLNYINDTVLATRGSRCSACGCKVKEDMPGVVYAKTLFCTKLWILSMVGLSVFKNIGSKAREQMKEEVE